MVMQANSGERDESACTFGGRGEGENSKQNIVIAEKKYICHDRRLIFVPISK